MNLSLHDIELLALTQDTFAMEIRRQIAAASAYSVQLAVNTDEVVTCVAKWSTAFDVKLKLAPKAPYFNFAKLAPGAWVLTLVGSPHEILQLFRSLEVPTWKVLVDPFKEKHAMARADMGGWSLCLRTEDLLGSLEKYIVPISARRQKAHTHDTAWRKFVQHMDETCDRPSSVSSDNVSDAALNVSLPSIICERPTYNEPPCDSEPPNYNQHPCNTNDSSKRKARDLQRTMPVMSKSELQIVHREYAQPDLPPVVSELVKLTKLEVSSIIGPQGKRIGHIRNVSGCRIAVLPVSNEATVGRYRSRDFPQTICLTGTAAQIQQARSLLRRALADLRSL